MIVHRKAEENYRERDKLVAEIAGGLLSGKLSKDSNFVGISGISKSDIENAVHVANLIVGLSDSRSLETR